MELIDTTYTRHTFSQTVAAGKRGCDFVSALFYSRHRLAHEELYNFIKSTDCCLSSCIWVENQRQKSYVKELFGQKIACDLGLKTVNFKGKYPSWFTVILDMMRICFF